MFMLRCIEKSHPSIFVEVYYRQGSDNTIQYPQEGALRPVGLRRGLRSQGPKTKWKGHQGNKFRQENEFICVLQDLIIWI